MKAFLKWHSSLIIAALTLILAADPILASAIEPVKTNQRTKQTESSLGNSQIAEQSNKSEGKHNLVGKILNGVDNQQQSLSDKIVSFSETIDTFFINDDLERRINYSHIQLGYR